MQRHLAKPIDPVALAAAVQQVTGPVAPRPAPPGNLQAVLLDLAPRLAGASAEELRRSLDTIRALPDMAGHARLAAAVSGLESAVGEGDEAGVAAARAALLAALDESLASLRRIRQGS
jgi:uncharacterized membrane protein YoaK (UPF0700 family)